ncbi:MAG: M20 metallopeptidase family protein [Thermomicrobiales bacterium]
MAIDMLKTDIDEIMPGVIADRRWLHQHPELGMQEYQTAAFVAERLSTMTVEDIRTGIANTGITALIHGTKPGPQRVAMIRADMDALPILEETNTEYASQVPGAMHACGHDAHTAMLLGVARMLIERRDQFSGSVKLLFQPAEEGPGGAEPMVKAGVLENPHVDAVFGMHVAQDLDLGKLEMGPGAVSANSDRFNAVIQGKGGHGATPHQTVDSVVVGAHVVVALQTLVAREVDPIDPAVVTVGKFSAGQANNVIADTAELRGTVRTFSKHNRQLLSTRIQEVIHGIAESFGGSATIEYIYRYPSVINDPLITALVRETAEEIVGDENVLTPEPQMGGEDFSYFALERPGCFFMVGTRNAEKGLIWGHHHPKFDIDEDGMAIGIETMTRSVMKYLNQG